MSPSALLRAALAIPALALLLGVTMLAIPGVADAAPQIAGHRPTVDRGNPATPTTVTLITGDRITLLPTPSGDPKVIVATDSDFTIRRDGDQIEVIPENVRDLVPDVLDPALFDVAGLVAMGYDDARSRTLPVIVRRAGSTRAMEPDTALGTPVELPSIRAAAMKLDKRRAGRIGADLARLAAQPGPATSAAASAALGGIDRIWLDGRVTAARAAESRTWPTTSEPAVAESELDPYLTRVGAPDAWSAGLDGTGVTIAVLDTGIDSEHPDLRGQIRSEQDFTGSASTGDLAGHGTHVASLVAGTGAGADGARKGLAPGAAILNGKVLGDDGAGQLSWVIAGMEWAVAEKADIVNLSLSAYAGVGDDPLVQALDSLTRSADTLFVVAAGNGSVGGWNPESVTSPGTAASALTVGATDADDAIARFSGQGPTRGSYRAKPDIAAPGVAILGARAGARTDDLYVEMDGTSMAAPIVAGAAALVQQRHPDWTWDQVRSAVTTSADHLEVPWATGAGRLAVENAVELTTTASPSTINLGLVRHPSEETITTTVDLTNTGSAPTTYTPTDAQLAPPDGDSAPADALVVAPQNTTIDPGETATLRVAFDPKQVDDGYWHGHIDLTEVGGSVLRVPIAAYVEPASHWLDLAVVDRNGNPSPSQHVEVLNLHTGQWYQGVTDSAGHERLRVIPGTYGVVSHIETDESVGTTVTLAGTPSLDINTDTRLKLDARAARQVVPPIIEGQDARATEFSLAWELQATANGHGLGHVFAPSIEDVLAGRMFVTPSAKGSPDTFQTASRWRLESIGHATSGAPDAYELLDLQDRFPEPAGTLTRNDVRDLAEVVERNYSLSDGTIARGLISLGKRGVGVVHRRDVEAPSTETVLMTADKDAYWGYESYLVNEGWQQLTTPELATLEPGSRVVRHFRRVLQGGIFAASHDPFGGLYIEQGLSDGQMLGRLNMEAIESVTTTLYRDGALVGTAPTDRVWFTPDPRSASYRLVADLELTSGVRSRSEWWFRSAAPPIDAADFDVPLLTVDYGPSVSMDGRAARGRDLEFDLRIGHLTGASADIRDAQLQWSVDGGETWSDASLRRRTATTFTSTVKGKLLRTGKTVSVRLRAMDEDGNRIDQTNIGLIPIE